VSQRGDSARARAREMALCSFCPKMCRAMCPVGLAEARETTITWGKMWQAYRVVEHGEAIDPAVASVFDACTGCGACTAFCEHGVDAAGALFAMRQQAYAAGASERSTRLADLFDATGLTVELDLATRYAEEIEGAAGPVALLPGVNALARRPGLSRLTAQTMRSLGIEIAALPAAATGLEVGQRLLWAGLHERFDANAARLASELAQVNTIVCLDPEDAYFLSVVFPARSVYLAPRITTVVEELARSIDRIPERPGPALAYHDPCYLGRRLGVFGAPRRVVERVLTEPPLEFAWTREHSECAGGGGLYPDANPEGARRTALRRWQSRPQGATAIVTACPEAEAMLIEAGGEAMDVIELVAGERIEAPARP